MSRIKNVVFFLKFLLSFLYYLSVYYFTHAIPYAAASVLFHIRILLSLYVYNHALIQLFLL